MWGRPAWTRCWTYGPAEAGHYFGSVRLQADLGVRSSVRLQADLCVQRSVRLQADPADPQEMVTRPFYMKREPMGNDRDQDNWLGTTLRRTSASAPDMCLDAETLAAWSDGGLGAKAAAAVELHASNCSRCAAVLGEMARSTPAASASHGWTPARVFRWLAPLAAAATAIGIWVVVPDRPIAPAQSASAARDLTAPELGTLNAEPGTQPTQPQTPNPAPSAPNLEPRARSAPGARVDRPAAEEATQMRDQLKRESAPPQALGAAADSAAKASAEAAPAPAAPSDTLAGPATAAARRSAFASVGMSAESVSPSNELIRWRIAAPASMERSTDGGKTWTRTTSPASTVAGVRAVDGERAVAKTSDGVEFDTTNGGLSGTRVQENTAAPF